MFVTDGSVRHPQSRRNRCYANLHDNLFHQKSQRHVILNDYDVALDWEKTFPFHEHFYSLAAIEYGDVVYSVPQCMRISVFCDFQYIKTDAVCATVVLDIVSPETAHFPFLSNFS